MSKHSIPTIWPTVEKKAPAHSLGWTENTEAHDVVFADQPYTPGKHAKPFGKHVAVPAIYDADGTVTPLRPTEHRLDVAA